MKAPVARILGFSAVDGPGNRSVVFLQGCNQNCLYCHNPETIHLCVSCGACVGYCSSGALKMEEGKVIYDKDKCVFCDACIKACPYDSSPRVRMMDASHVMKELEKNLPFIRGLTVSGGECTLYPEFLLELASEIHRKGKTIYLDTNGQKPLSEELLDAVDSVMIDLKASSAEEFFALTGNRNEHIQDNIRNALEKGKLSELRTVVCPDAMDYRKTVALGASLIKDSSARYKLIRYRPNGVRTMYQGQRVPSEEEMQDASEIARAMGVEDILII